MTSFLFWNVGQRDLCPLLGQAVKQYGIDVLMLAESPSEDADVVAALRAATKRDFTSISETDDNVRVFASVPQVKWKRRAIDLPTTRMSVWQVRFGRTKEVFLATAHFVSKLFADDDEQALLVSAFARELSYLEDYHGNQRTILVGDLNMNPYEAGVLGSLALNAALTQPLAAKGERIVQGLACRYFYNPMWGFFGDRTTGPPGTYYHHSPSVVDPQWHMFDQVLLRPTLMQQLQEVQILASIEGESLLTVAGLPNTAYSDHLPLLFRMDFTRG